MPEAPANSSTENSRFILLVPTIIAAVYFLAHMATATRYGYFRDALYYLACSEHLAWGYVDQPPLIVFIAWIARHTLGISLPALLLYPALAGTARILLTAALARELGANRLGTALAAALAATPAVWYVNDHQFAMNAFEPLFWTGCAFAVARMIHTNNSKWWIAFGAIAGLGLENKYSIAAFVFSASCPAANSATQIPLYSVDFGGRVRSVAVLSPKPALEYSAPLAISGVDAQHSRVRPRCGFVAGCVSMAAVFDDDAGYHAVLAGWVVLLFFSRREKVSRLWLDVYLHYRIFLSDARKELLFRTGLSVGFSCGRRSDRKLFIEKKS